MHHINRRCSNLNPPLNFTWVKQLHFWRDFESPTSVSELFWIAGIFKKVKHFSALMIAYVFHKLGSFISENVSEKFPIFVSAIS